MSSEFNYYIIVHPEEGYIYINAQGSIDLDRLKQMYSSILTSPMYRKEMNRLWDFTRIDVSRLTSEDLRSFAAYMKFKDLGTDMVNAAILVTRDLEYGMVRMLQALGDGVLSPNVIVTRNLDEALTWVRKPDAKDIGTERV